MAAKISKRSIAAAIDALNRVRKQWMRRPGVGALDVGYKISGGQLTNELAVRVHVARKLPVESIAAAEAFNSSESPQELDGFPVDVIEADYAASAPAPMAAEAVDRMGRVDPLIGGVSCGNPRVSAGTLGAIVWDARDGAPCILSNWHVLCGSLTASVGEPIYQPGVLDGGAAADQVAELRRWRLDRDADAAIARLIGARGYSRDLLGLDPIIGIEDAQLGMQVVKSGRTTGVTRGVVDGVAASVRIDYGEKVQQFEDQIHIVPRPPWPQEDYEVSLGGDSGSVWVNEESGRAVGLHFAGETDRSPAAENAMANRIGRVAELLELSFAPLFLPPPAPLDAELMAATRSVLRRRLPDLRGTSELGAETGEGDPGDRPSIDALMAEIERAYRMRRPGL